MPRIARVLLPGHIYHLTHRCHNGSFFLRFDTVRTEYRRRLWRAVRDFGIQMLNYCLTSNHTHLLLKVRRPALTSGFMRRLEGEFAAAYNRRKRRCGAFWSERYHATLIEDGAHLWNCMRYIDLNMVRAGVVDHPIDWRWCGFQEISSQRLRYRILELDELLRLADVDTSEAFAEWYLAELNEAMRAGHLRYREPHWTESIAVGSEDFVRKIAGLARNRKKFENSQWADSTWYVRDAEGGYGGSGDQPGLSKCTDSTLEKKIGFKF